MQIDRPSKYRWYMLVLAMLTFGVITGLDRLCMPVLFDKMAQDLNLSMVAIGGVWGADPLAGVFIGLPGGLLADRFGVRRTLVVLCILAGVFGALRGITVNFVSMAAVMFLFGLMAAAAPSVVPKVTADWFSGRQLGVANALIHVAWAIFSMSATMFSATLVAPAIGGWRNVMFLFGAPAVMLGLLWLFTGREPPKQARPDMLPESAIPFRESLRHVLRMKQIWIIGSINMALWGASMGFIGYLPLYMLGQGWSQAAADGTVTLIAGIGMVGAVPTVMVADRTSRNAVLTISIASLALGLALIPLASGPAIWLLVAWGGLMRSGAQSIITVMIFETKGIGSTYGGTAVGLSNTIAMLGAFAAPPIGNSLTFFSPGAPLYFWGALAATGIPLVYMIKDRR
jgi:MFS family permease